MVIMMNFEKVKRSTTLEIIIKQIKDQIRSGEIQPGDKLPSERELSEMMEVSRNSVREAIKALTFSGYLDVIQGKGAYVSQSALKYDEISNLLSNVSDYSLSSLMEVREMLEGEIVKLATMRATDEEIGEIIKAYDAIKSSKDVKEFVREDLNFHLYIASVTHNPLMNALMKVFGEMLHRETNQITQESIRIKEKTIEVTGRLVKAISNREEEKAKKLMLEHIRIVKIALK